MNQKNPNIRTAAFGPVLWASMFLIAMGFPEKNPTRNQKKKYREFFRLVGEVMPCSLCRDSYKQFTARGGPCYLSYKPFENRKALVYYLMKLKNEVNRKLGCKILDSKGMRKVYAHYDSFRAKSCKATELGCIKSARGKRYSPMKLKVVKRFDSTAL